MLTVTTLAAWLLHLMVLTVPPGTHQNARSVETSSEQADRYAQVARALAVVALDPAEPSVYGDGKDGMGRARTATLLLSVAYFESAWRKDVDLGVTRGDGGKSCTLWQLNLGQGRTPEGWGCDELVADREKAVRAALHMLQRSALACRNEAGPEAVLFAYASGKCDGEAAAFAGLTVRDVTKLRTERARRWWREQPLREWRRAHPEVALAAGF